MPTSEAVFHPLQNVTKIAVNAECTCGYFAETPKIPAANTASGLVAPNTTDLHHVAAIRNHLHDSSRKAAIFPYSKTLHGGSQFDGFR